MRTSVQNRHVYEMIKAMLNFNATRPATHFEIVVACNAIEHLIQRCNANDPSLADDDQSRYYEVNDDDYDSGNDDYAAFA